MIQPLRDARRAAASSDRAALLARELDAERDLMDQLETVPVSIECGASDPPITLAAISATWGRPLDPSAFRGLIGEPPMSDEEASNDEDFRLREMLARLRQAHQDLDAAVEALNALPRPDQLQIARLKKRKLVLRDQIAKLENSLTPDLIA